MTQQHVLEQLSARVRSGGRPVVRVGDLDYEFKAVSFGGSSPLVQLADGSGVVSSRTAAQWTKAGAKFAARSRDLAGRSRKKAELAASPVPSYGAAEMKSSRDLERDLRAVMGSLPIGSAATGGRVRVRGKSLRGTGGVLWLRADGTPSNYESEGAALTEEEAQRAIADYEAYSMRTFGAPRWSFDLVPTSARG